MSLSSATDFTACFSVQSCAEPAVMPRLMELFVKRGLTPTRWSSEVVQGGLAIDIEMDGMDQALAAYVGRCMRQVTGVEVVLTSERAGPGKVAEKGVAGAAVVSA